MQYLNYISWIYKYSSFHSHSVLLILLFQVQYHKITLLYFHSSHYWDHAGIWTWRPGFSQVGLIQLLTNIIFILFFNVCMQRLIDAVQYGKPLVSLS